MFKMLVAKLRDRYAVKVPVHEYSEAPCPSCGYTIEVPLTRTPVPVKCSQCKQTTFSVAVGIVDPEKDRLIFVYDSIVRHIHERSMGYKKSEHTIN